MFNGNPKKRNSWDWIEQPSDNTRTQYGGIQPQYNSYPAEYNESTSDLFNYMTGNSNRNGLVEAMSPWDVAGAGVAGKAVAKATGELAKKGLQKGIGRVVTNTLSPVGYIMPDINYLAKEVGVRRILKSIIDDVPVKKVIANDLNWGSREYPYRKMFGLEPRPDLYNSKSIKNLGNGKATFRPNEIADEFDLRSSAMRMKGHGHPTMSNYSYKENKPGFIDYGDVWDFGLNKGEALPPLKELFKVENGNARVMYARKFMDWLTDPVEFVGRVRVEK
jgi:hypothetical protein